MESALDSVTTDNALLWELADTVMSPTVSITEEDCGTLLGENVVADYDAEGLMELSTGVGLTRARINALRTSGQGKVDVRSLRSCIAPGGLCRVCLGANRPLLHPVPAVGSRIKILPETFLQITQANLPPGETDIPLDFSPEQYDFLYLYGEGLLIPASDYTISGKILSLTAAPSSVPPTLLLHFDSNFVDTAGGTTFSMGYNTGLEVSATPTFTSSFSPAFSQRAVVVGQSGSPGVSTSSMSIGVNPFTIEGRSRLTTGATGGIILAKSFWASQSLSTGSVGPDWVLSVQSDRIRLSWGSTAGTRMREITFSPLLDQDFAWAISDDGTTFRIYINGVLISSQTSVALDSFPPPTSASQASLFNAISGFLGSTPNWGGSGYQGIIDELAVTLGTAKYLGSSYSVATLPFTMDFIGRDFTIKYVVISRITFYYWLAATFSGAMLGIKPLPTRPLILKKQLLLENIPESLVEEITGDLEGRGEVTEDFTGYLRTIKDPLEAALFAILLGSIFLNF